MAPEVVQALLDADDADPNARDNYEETPLHAAARWSMAPAVVQVLLDAPGTDINARNKRGLTPLYVATQENMGVPGVAQAIRDADGR